MTSSLVLVTGGAGFIGSHLCEGLLRRGSKVRVLDDLSVGKRENVPAGCEFFQGSILDDSILEQAVSGCDAICHEAARVTIRGSLEQFYEDAATNMMGTLKLLRASSRKKIRRFIYASSMAVYADSPDRVPVSENSLTVPASPYGIGKLSAESYVLMMGKHLGVETVVLRYFNTFGTRQTFTPYVGVITIFATQLLQGKGILIFGDGDQTRDFVHVSDIVQANLLALNSPSVNGEVFNVGTGRGTTVNQLAALMKNKLYSDAPVEHAPARAEELRFSVADISHARKILGYGPATDLALQIDEVIQFLRTDHA